MSVLEPTYCTQLDWVVSGKRHGGHLSLELDIVVEEVKTAQARLGKMCYQGNSKEIVADFVTEHG